LLEVAEISKAWEGSLPSPCFLRFYDKQRS
jgi:hypothetical protein